MDMSQSKSMAMPSGGIKRNGRRSWLAWNAIVGDAMLTGSAEVVKGKGFAVSKERESATSEVRGAKTASTLGLASNC